MGFIKDAIDRWYDRLNYFQQTVVQFVTSVLVLLAITGLGGLVFCGFETDQASPATAPAAWDGIARWPRVARGEGLRRPAPRAPATVLASRCARNARAARDKRTRAASARQSRGRVPCRRSSLSVTRATALALGADMPLAPRACRRRS